MNPNLSLAEPVLLLLFSITRELSEQLEARVTVAVSCRLLVWLRTLGGLQSTSWAEIWAPAFFT